MSAPPGGIVCSRTGLYLLAAAGESGYRVAKDKYVRQRGVLSTRPNATVGPLPYGTPETRGRFDTVGRTVYFADSQACAFAEVLQGFRKARNALAADAIAIGMDVDEYVELVTKDAINNGRETPWAITCDWQWERSVYKVRMPVEGFWVAVDHPLSLMSIDRHLRGALSLHGVAQVTAAHLAGENRSLTTTIAQAIRGLTLDGGHQPLGITFESKTLAGRCWAFWDRRADDALEQGGNDPSHLSDTNVDVPAFRAIAQLYDLPVLPGRPKY